MSYNGKSSSNGAVILFVKTLGRFEIVKENIFQPSGKQVMLTDVNPEKRLVNAIDGKNPRKRYAEILGINEHSVDNALLDHPFGRVFGEQMFMYARVLNNSVQEILEPMDAVAIAEKTCQDVLEKIPNPGCVILFNCILRTLGFEKHNQQSSINNVWKRYFKQYSGFSTYGEQFERINSNQTLVMLVLE